jgi:eukaryotic-like serine/threonine-protein kinase
VLASADGASHGSEDPKDHTNHQKYAAYGHQHGDSRDESHDQKHHSENDHLSFLFILDTPQDGAYDRITALAARLFTVPIAIVSVVDNDRIWFKSHHGVDIGHVDREPGLCASAILQNEPWVIQDARTDSRALSNPLVAGELGLQFYAGIPLRTREGYNLGTLCIIDRQPRTLNNQDLRTLEDLAAIVMNDLGQRMQSLRVA